MPRALRLGRPAAAVRRGLRPADNQWVLLITSSGLDPFMNCRSERRRGHEKKAQERRGWRGEAPPPSSPPLFPGLATCLASVPAAASAALAAATATATAKASAITTVFAAIVAAATATTYGVATCSNRGTVTVSSRVLGFVWHPGGPCAIC